MKHPRFTLVVADRDTTNVLMDGNYIGYLFQDSVMQESASPTRFYASREAIKTIPQLKELNGICKSHETLPTILKAFKGYLVNGDNETICYDFTGANVGYIVRFSGRRYLYTQGNEQHVWTKSHPVHATAFEKREYAEKALGKIVSLKNGDSGEREAVTSPKIITKKYGVKRHYIASATGPDTLMYKPTTPFAMGQYVRFEDTPHNLKTAEYYLLTHLNKVMVNMHQSAHDEIAKLPPHNRKAAEAQLDLVRTGRGKIVGIIPSSGHVKYNITHESYLGGVHGAVSGLDYSYAVAFFKQMGEPEQGHQVVMVTLDGRCLKAD